jgi:hypothetical protein
MALTKANSTVIDITDTGNAIKTNSAVGLAPLDSPTFIGSPSAPTQANSDNTTRLATTAYVTTKTNFLAPLANPYFTGQVFLPEGTSSVPGLTFQNDGAPDTGLYHISDGVFGVTCNAVPVAKFQSTGMSLLGTPTAPTAAAGNNSTQIATTAFVMANSSTTAATTYGAIGSSYLNSTGYALTVNTLYTNTPATFGDNGIPLPPGTWRCMGSGLAYNYPGNSCTSAYSYYINLFVRVS